MKKLLIIPIAALSLGLASCGEVCVRCENGLTADTETECFTNDDERDEYVNAREAVGFTCNDK